MQKYYSLKVRIEEPKKEFLIAALTEINFDTILETDDGFEASMEESQLDKKALQEILNDFEINPNHYELQILEQQNWNALWESEFEPVCIDQQLRVRAPFHQADPSYSMELVIQPKTSFGTGHHETTELILSLMLKEDMQGKHIFDFGSGTGILAILAAKKGAASILANDIDDWAAQNIYENATLNGVDTIEFIHGDLTQVKSGSFDIILANINRNVLATSFAQLATLMKPKASLFISGFYVEDLTYLLPFISSSRLLVAESISKNNWCAARLALLD